MASCAARSAAIAPVLRIAVAVIVDGHQLAANMLAHQLVPARVFVNVVAEVHDEIEVFFGHVLIGGEETDLEMLA